MIDLNVTINTALLTRTALTAIIGARLWPDTSEVLAGYTPNDGGALAFRIRGGDVLYRGGVARVSVQFKCWGIDNSTANQVESVLYDVLHDQAFGGIKSAYIEQIPQSSEEPDTEWPFVLAFYALWLAVV